MRALQDHVFCVNTDRRRQKHSKMNKSTSHQILSELLRFVREEYGHYAGKDKNNKSEGVQSGSTS